MSRRPTCVSRLGLLRDDVARHGLSVRSRREDDLIGCSKTVISYLSETREHHSRCLLSPASLHHLAQQLGPVLPVPNVFANLAQFLGPCVSTKASNLASSSALQCFLEMSSGSSSEETGVPIWMDGAAVVCMIAACSVADSAAARRVGRSGRGGRRPEGETEMSKLPL